MDLPAHHKFLEGGQQVPANWRFVQPAAYVLLSLPASKSAPACAWQRLLKNTKWEFHPARNAARVGCETEDDAAPLHNFGQICGVHPAYYIVDVPMVDGRTELGSHGSD